MQSSIVHFMRFTCILTVLLWTLAACGIEASTADLTVEQFERDPLLQQFRADLAQQGIELTAPDVSRVEWLRAAPGFAYRLDDAEWLHVHVYPNAAAVDANVARIPPSADTGATDWVNAPHFFRWDRIIALYLGQNEQVMDILTERCGPQFAGQ